MRELATVSIASPRGPSVTLILSFRGNAVFDPHFSKSASGVFSYKMCQKKLYFVKNYPYLARYDDGIDRLRTSSKLLATPRAPPTLFVLCQKTGRGMGVVMNCFSLVGSSFFLVGVPSIDSNIILSFISSIISSIIPSIM